MKKCLASFSAALALTLFAAAAQAADYYVATNGSANAAGTMAAPWTFAKAVSATGAGPGDTVYVRGGTYNGAVNFTRSGSAGSWITFRAYQGELPIIQGSGGSGVSSSSAQYVRFIGIAVRNFTSSGFGNGWVDDTGTSNGNLQFINCIADNNGINGIAFYNASGVLVENSIIAHNGNGSPSQPPRCTGARRRMSGVPRAPNRRRGLTGQCARYVCDLHENARRYYRSIKPEGLNELARLNLFEQVTRRLG